MQKFAMSLNHRNHAGHHVLAPQQPPSFRLETRPSTGREFPQQLAIEASVNAQTLRDGQDDLSMGDRRADVFGNVQRGQQRAFLVARGTRGHRRAAMVGPVAGESDEPGTMFACMVGAYSRTQRTRAKPPCRSPHLRKAATDCWTVDRQNPYLA